VALILRRWIDEPWSRVTENAEANGKLRLKFASLALRALVAVRVLRVEFRLRWDPQGSVLLCDVFAAAGDVRRHRDADARPWVDGRDDLPRWSGAILRILRNHVVHNPQVIDALKHLD
jgi:hypothetical protein